LASRLSSLSRSVTPSRSCAYKSDERLLDLSRAITLAGFNGSSQVSDVRWPSGDSSKTDATVISCSTLLPRGRHPCSGCQDNGYLDAASMVPSPLHGRGQHCEALRTAKQRRATILNETHNASRNAAGRQVMCLNLLPTPVALDSRKAICYDTRILRSNGTHSSDTNA